MADLLGGLGCCWPPGFFFAFSSASFGSIGFDILPRQIVGSQAASALPSNWNAPLDGQVPVYFGGRHVTSLVSTQVERWFASLLAVGCLREFRWQQAA